MSIMYYQFRVQCVFGPISGSSGGSITLSPFPHLTPTSLSPSLIFVRSLSHSQALSLSLSLEFSANTSNPQRSTSSPPYTRILDLEICSFKFGGGVFGCNQIWDSRAYLIFEFGSSRFEVGIFHLFLCVYEQIWYLWYLKYAWFWMVSKGAPLSKSVDPLANPL